MEFFESGDQLLVFIKTRARPKGSSVAVEFGTGHLWMIRDGTVVSLRIFAGREEALKAAGLRE